MYSSISLLQFIFAGSFSGPGDDSPVDLLPYYFSFTIVLSVPDIVTHPCLRRASQACWYLLHSFNLFKYLLSSLIVPVYSQSGRSQWKQSGHLQLDNLIPIGSPFDLPAAVHIVVRSAFVKAALFLTSAIKFLQCSASALDRLTAHTVIKNTVHFDFCHRLSPLNKVFRPSTGG